MRAIRNLVWFLLAFALTVWAGLASAQTRDTYYRGTLNTAQIQARTAEAVCRYLLSQQTGGSGWEYVGVELPYCLRKSTSGSTLRSGNVVQFTCPASTPYFNDKVGGCVATAPEPDPEPEPPAPCPEDSPGVSFWPSGDRDKPVPAFVAPANIPGCVSGCFVKGVNVRNCKSYGENPRVYCEWETVTTGARCTAGDPQYENPPDAAPTRQDVPPFDSPQGPCPKGTVNGGISDTGLQRCIGTGSDPKNKPPSPPKTETEKTETAEDGTKTTTKTEITTNSDGSKTTTTTVTITKPDGTKQVDQQKDTSKTPANQPGKDDSTKDDEKYDLCKQNPHLTICQNSSVAGKCGETSCTGDAIQCATLRAAAAMQCKQDQEAEALQASASSKLGEAILAGADPMKSQIDELMKGTEVDLSSPNLDQSSFLPSSCLSVRSFHALGQTISVDFAKLCEYIAPLRFVILAISFILAYRIVSGSVINS